MCNFQLIWHHCESELNLYFRQRILPNSVIKPQANTTPPSTPPRAGSGRPSPMRASHQISTQVLSLQSDTKTPPGVLINSHNNTSGKRSPSGSQRNTLSRELSSESQRITGSRSLQRSKPLTDQPPTLHRHIPEAPTHLSIRTELPPNSKIVRVGSLAVGRSDSAHHTPSPPSAARPSSNRPGSANRFRRMVLNCRDDTWAHLVMRCLLVVVWFACVCVRVCACVCVK